MLPPSLDTAIKQITRRPSHIVRSGNGEEYPAKDQHRQTSQRPSLPKVSPLDEPRVLVPVPGVVHHHYPHSTEKVRSDSEGIPYAGRIETI